MIDPNRHRVLAAVAYLAWAIPFALALSWLIPPWQSPDEPAHHPAAIWLALQNTLALSSNELALEATGKLGWLDTTLDPRVYDVALTLLLLGIASTLGGHTRRPYLPVAIILSRALCLVTAQYLTWTKPGSASVAGLQSRYFEVPLAVACLCLPGAQRQPRSPGV